MSFNEQISYQLYPDSSPTTFTISDFYFTHPEYIRVRVYTADGDVIEKVQPDDWTIQGRTIERTAPAWEPGQVLVFRDNAYDQLNTWRNAEIDFDRELMEFTFDYVTMLAQQNQDIYAKSIRAPLFDPATNFELPIPEQRQQRFITFDAQGNVVVRPLNSSDVGAANIRWIADFTGYTAGWIVEHNGFIWRGVDPEDGVAPSTANPDQWALVTRDFLLDNKWQADVDYTTGVILFHNNKIWLAAANNRGSEPSEANPNWHVQSNRFNVLVSGNYAYDAQYPEFTIFVNTATSATVTLNLPTLDDRRVTVAVSGGGEVHLTGPGVSTTVRSGFAREVVGQDGTWYLLANSANGTTEWEKTMEDPPFGEELPSGELFLDGTDSLISSEGREDLGGIVDYIPAVENVDGSRYTPPELKWPERGTYGFFGEYENHNQSITSSPNGSISNEGGWNKLSAIADSIAVTAKGTNFPLGTTQAYTDILVRKGVSIDVSYESFVYHIANGGNGGRAKIQWNTETFSFDGGAVDDGCVFIDSETVRVRFHSTFSAITVESQSHSRLDINSLSADISAGDSVYFKDWMTVLNINYPVPYTPGTHQASKLPYNFDWAASDEWTIEGWFKTKEELTNRVILDTRKGALNGVRLLISGTDEALFFVHDDSGQQGVVGAGTITSGTYNHVKAIITPTVLRLSLNGNPLGNSGPVTIDTTTFFKSLLYGLLNTGGEHLDGYLQDFRIVSGIDTSNDHYLSGLPYYDPQKTYGKNAMWSADHDGILTGELTGKGIVEKYKIGTQQVTKYADGRMTIIGTDAQSFPCQIAAGALFRNDGTVRVDYAESFDVTFQNVVLLVNITSGVVDTVSARARTQDQDGFTYYMFTNVSKGSLSYNVTFVAEGRWK